MKTLKTFLKEASSIKPFVVGDILLTHDENYDYGMRTPSFYMITKISDSNIWYVKIDKKEVSGNKFLPNPSKKLGSETKSKFVKGSSNIDNGNNGAIEVGYKQWARLWDKAPFKGSLR